MKPRPPSKLTSRSGPSRVTARAFGVSASVRNCSSYAANRRWPRSVISGTASDAALAGAEHAELVALRIGEHHPGRVRRLPDVDPDRPERLQPLHLPVTVVGGEIDVEAVLDRLRLGHRHEDQCRVGVVVLRHDDLVGLLEHDLPVEHLGPPLGEPFRLATVYDDRVETQAHALTLP